MARAKKSWREKLADSKGHPSLFEPHGLPSVGLMLIPAPMEVDEVMRSVRKGELITIDGIRERLAVKHGADVTCPITTGIFAWIAAHAADEAEQEGKQRITPYWRTLKKGGELNPKYPGGIENVQSRLEAEGHRVVRRGKRVFVEEHGM